MADKALDTSGQVPPPIRNIGRSSQSRVAKNKIPDSILQNESLNLAISLLPANYNFEVHKTVWRLQTDGPSVVALQFPEGLLMYSCIIADIFKSFAGVEVLVLGDVTYGACCIDDFTAHKLGADLIIHYGHSCLVPVNVTRIKVLYVFVEVRSRARPIWLSSFIVAQNIQQMLKLTHTPPDTPAPRRPDLFRLHAPYRMRQDVIPERNSHCHDGDNPVCVKSASSCPPAFCAFRRLLNPAGQTTVCRRDPGVHISRHIECGCARLCRRRALPFRSCHDSQPKYRSVSLRPLWQGSFLGRLRCGADEIHSIVSGWVGFCLAFDCQPTPPIPTINLNVPPSFHVIISQGCHTPIENRQDLWINLGYPRQAGKPRHLFETGKTFTCSRESCGPFSHV